MRHGTEVYHLCQVVHDLAALSVKGARLAVGEAERADAVAGRRDERRADVKVDQPGLDQIVVGKAAG